MASSAATRGAAKRHATKRGQPTALTRPIPLHAELLPQGEAIARLIRTGLPIKEAAQALGLSYDAAYRCLGDGRVVAGLLLEGRLIRDQLSDFQAAAFDFYERVDKAEAEALALHASAIAKHAQGGNVRKRTVISYDETGRETGRQVTEEILPSDLKASTFWVERRRPDLFGRSERVELAAGIDGPQVGTARPRDRLLEALEAIRRRKALGASVLEAVATDAAPVDEGAEAG